ncbi:protein PALS1-like isoform X1 [Diadema antillarum]|uniref:protein PALS1-like isoform X1 n=1 Tax=Diadema antillarum TaxID=105358 RepID=UPI003A891BFB
MMNGDVELGPVSINGMGHYGDQDEEGYENDGFELHEESNWNSGRTEEVIDLMTILEIGTGDERFGFSVMGGLEEGFLPNVDAILEGSPADRADLKIGDEILEVNGRSLEDATHEQVISYIHQCVKSKKINLRVRRRTVREGGQDDLEKKRLQQAYVIAVEQQTRDNFAKIAAHNNVPAIDLSELNKSDQHASITNGHAEVELHGHTNGYPEPELAASGTNPEATLTATPVDIPDDRFNSTSDRLSKLFGEDVQAAKESEGGYDNPTFSLEFQPVVSDASVSESGSIGPDVVPPVQEPHIQANVLSAEEVPPIDLTKLEAAAKAAAATKASSSAPAISQRNKMPEPSAAVRVESQPRVPREVAVDCPPGFVAASGMKNPPTQSVLNAKVNGHTLTNGTDSLSANSRQNNINLESESRRDKDIHKHTGVMIQQNASQNNSQGSVAFEPVNNHPLFDEATTSRQYSVTEPPPQKVLGLDDLLATLSLAQAKLSGPQDRDDLLFLQQFFHNSDVQHAVSIQHRLGHLQHSRSPPLPVAANSETLAAEISYNSRGGKGEVDELRRLLSKPVLRGLLRAHDDVASPDPAQLPTDVYPQLYLSENAEESVKIVKLEKTGEPLGATILNNDDAIIIGRIIRGGMAEKSGLLHEGDEILQINGEDVTGKSVNEISDLMASLTGTMVFLIVPSTVPAQQPPTANTVLMHVKANFDYDPEDDMYIPCRELGLSFRKGDILHVIAQDDPSWWQAYREGDEDQTLAGLIPSKTFQQQREAMKQPLPDDDQEAQNKSFLCSCRGKKPKKKKKKKKLFSPNEDEEDEILTYEEVGLYQPESQHKRPIVLIGPPHVGRQELKQRLLESDRRFKAAVPHTTRSMKEHEINGVDYHFISKTRFEQDVAANKFVESGDYEGNLYGTSLDSIQAVINESKICLLNLHAQVAEIRECMLRHGAVARALRMLKKSSLKPYFIFICPPSIDRLRQQRIDAGDLLKEQELREIIDAGRGMEDAFGHYFDHVIIHHDHDRAYNELMEEIDRIQVEPQWVPVEWLS